MKSRTIQIPDAEKKLTVKDKVFMLLCREEYTTKEIALKLNIQDRVIRDSIMQLKRVYNIKETRCRCGHSPIYTVKK